MPTFRPWGKADRARFYIRLLEGVVRKLVIAAATLAWATAAWAITDTSVTITDEGQPVPEATISLATSEGSPPKAIKRSDSAGHVPVRYDEKKVKPATRVHIVVHARIRTREGRTERVTREVDVSMETLISGRLTIDVGRGSSVAPPGLGAPLAFPGTYVGGGLGGRWTQCPDFHTVGLVSSGGDDEVGDNNHACASSGFRGSIMIGHNWQLAPAWVMGVEGDLGLANSSGTIAGIPGTAGVIVPAGLSGNDHVNMKETWDAGLRGRLGYLITPYIMVFGSGGVAWQHVQATLNCSAPGTCGFNGIPAFSANASTTLTGWSVGGGVDVKLADQWTARGEYRYSDYGTWQTTLGTPATLAVTSNITMRTHTALFGLAYTFAVPK